MTLILHWLAHWLGLTDASGPIYSFWSGFGSDITEFAIFAIVYRRLVCHDSRCHRLGLHHVEGTPYLTCRRHHPTLASTGRVTAADIHAAHHRGIHRDDR